MLATFTEKVADLDVVLDSGDTVTLLTHGYAHVRRRSRPRTSQGAGPRAVLIATVDVTAVNAAMIE